MGHVSHQRHRTIDLGRHRVPVVHRVFDQPVYQLLAEAIPLGRELEVLGVGWFEEPLATGMYALRWTCAWLAARRSSPAGVSGD